MWHLQWLFTFEGDGVLWFVPLLLIISVLITSFMKKWSYWCTMKLMFPCIVVHNFYGCHYVEVVYVMSWVLPHTYLCLSGVQLHSTVYLSKLLNSWITIVTAMHHWRWPDTWHSLKLHLEQIVLGKFVLEVMQSLYWCHSILQLSTSITHVSLLVNLMKCFYAYMLTGIPLSRNWYTTFSSRSQFPLWCGWMEDGMLL